MMKGCFITFEGGEGAGKTTLIEKVAVFLTQNKIAFIQTREPGGTPFSEELRSILLRQEGSLSTKAELLLFLSARAQAMEEVILPALEKGKVVLCDRFHDSSLAYQGAGRGLSEKEGVSRIYDLCLFASNGIVPDLSFYLDLDPAIGLQRASGARPLDRIEKESFEFHQKVRKAYLAIAKKEPKRLRVLDATRSPDELFAKTKEILVSFCHFPAQSLQ